MSMRFRVFFPCAVMLGVASAANADVSATVTLTSNYVSRGYTQTDDGPAIQGSIDYAHDSGFYAGTWASTIDFNDDEADVEVDLYAGYANTMPNGLGYDVGYAYYLYPGADSDLDYDYGEFYASLSAAVAEPVTVGLKVLYSPEYFGHTGDAWYVVGSADWAVTDEVTLGAAVGHSFGDAWEDAEYTDWSLSASTSLGGFDLSLAYTDTDISEDDDPDELADAKIVFSIGRTF